MYPSKFIEVKSFPLKTEQFLKVFSISLSLKIYHSIILNFFFFGEIWACLIDNFILLFFEVVYINYYALPIQASIIIIIYRGLDGQSIIINIDYFEK